MTYVLDSNVFIEAHRRYYAFPICPGFWDALVWHDAAGTWCSIDKIREELMEGKDALTDWVDQTVRRDAFCSTNQEEVTLWYGRIMQWAYGRQQYTDEAKSLFAEDPDAWLIAYAKAKNLTLVTHEGSHSDSKAKIYIPDVCAAFGMQPIDSFAMLGQISASFDWRPPS